MKSKLYIVAILTLFLVSFIFFTVFTVKNIKALKEKDTCINEQKTKIETLEKNYKDVKAENDKLTIKVNELTEENSRLVKLMEELQADTIQIEPEPEQTLEDPAPVKQFVVEEEETTKECVTEEKKEEVTTEASTESVATTEEATEVATEESTKATAESEDNSSSGLRYSEPYDYASNHLTRSNGVVHYNGHKETWYSTNEAGGQATAISIPGKHVADDGTIRDADGYICVATHQGFYQYGDVIQTTLGPAKVYDCGCSYGTVDIYTTW